jgi:hypothetical protein
MTFRSTAPQLASRRESGPPAITANDWWQCAYAVADAGTSLTAPPDARSCSVCAAPEDRTPASAVARLVSDLSAKEIDSLPAVLQRLAASESVGSAPPTGSCR